MRVFGKRVLRGYLDVRERRQEETGENWIMNSFITCVHLDL
jgi:hypothetical protein